MADYLLYAHLDRVDVSKGQVIQPWKKIGIIGGTGLKNNSYGKHLHIQYQKDSRSIANFSRYDKDHQTIDPEKFIKEYGKVTPNDKTLGYLSTAKPYSASKKHLGIDYSGVIDKDYESKYAYSPKNATVEVVSTNSKLGVSEFGKYIIVKVVKKGSSSSSTSNKTIKLYRKHKNVLNVKENELSRYFKRGVTYKYVLKNNFKGWKSGTGFNLK